MSLANYADLKSSVIDFLHRSDLAGIAPDLITLAEVRINGDLDSRLQDTRTTLACVASTESVALPTDSIQIRRLMVSSSTPEVVLEYMTPDNISATYSWGYTGTPQAYTLIGSNIYLAPIPDSAYTLDITYKAKVPNLALNSTNYLMTNFPNVYLYAALCEAAPYIKDDARVSLWETKYTESIKSVNTQDWFNGSSPRVKADVTV